MTVEALGTLLRAPFTRRSLQRRGAPREGFRNGMEMLGFFEFFTEILTAFCKRLRLPRRLCCRRDYFVRVSLRQEGFRERHEAERDATGPSRLSKPFAYRP
jgi:hypothetical protein